MGHPGPVNLRANNLRVAEPPLEARERPAACLPADVTQVVTLHPLLHFVFLKVIIVSGDVEC